MRKERLFVDDVTGDIYHARTVAELRRQIYRGGCRVYKMYAESRRTGKTYHVGYYIGGLWLRAFVQSETYPGVFVPWQKEVVV